MKRAIVIIALTLGFFANLFVQIYLWATGINDLMI